MIAILRRDDLYGVYFVTQTDDPWGAAVQLCAEHLFDIDVIVTLHADIDDVLEALENCHIRGGWHRCSLQHIFEVCAKLCIEEPCDKEADMSAVQKNPFPDNTDLPSCLSFCQAVHAPLSTSLRKDLVQLLGKEEARLVIKQLTAKTTRRGAETYRLFSFNGFPVQRKS